MRNFVGIGGVWESNPPTGGLTRSTGFEVQGPHQQPNASRADILDIYTTGVKHLVIVCARKCTRQSSGHFLGICRADDVVAIEHASGFVPGRLQCHPFQYASVHRVPHRGAPEVMPHPARAPRLQTRGMPGSPEILNSLASVPTPKMRKEVGDDTPDLQL